jgi:hypothetical protein
MAVIAGGLMLTESVLGRGGVIQVKAEPVAA